VASGASAPLRRRGSFGAVNWVLVLLAVCIVASIYYSRQNATPIAVADPIAPEELDGIEYYWRPGCPFCAHLERSLLKSGIPLNRHNIWDDPNDAATVRSYADGNETVPTLVIGPIALVNPSPTRVRAALREHAPHLL